MFLYQILAFTIHGKFKKLQKNNEFEMLAPTLNNKIESSDESNPLSDVQDYFQLIIKKYETVTVNLQKTIYVNKMENYKNYNYEIMKL